MNNYDIKHIFKDIINLHFNAKNTFFIFFSISGKAEGKAEKQDVNGNEPENHSHLRFYLELKGQRRVPAGTELTIRYNSVFEVRFWRENSNY